MIENWNFHDKAAAVLLVYDGLPACVYCLEEAEQYKPREDYSRKSGIGKRDIIIDYKTTFAESPEDNLAGIANRNGRT